jgi:hypothetical protein|tara:strand:- start:58 stop:306 length:249 start_codon:yes stop_codon:yes gene_type:complete
MSKFFKQQTKGQIMADKTLKDLVKEAVEDLIVDNTIIIEDAEGNKIEDLVLNVVNNDEEDFDDEDGEENEEDSSEDDEEEDE